MAQAVQLADNKIDVWLCLADQLQDKFDYFKSVLSAQEISRANRYKFDIHRTNFVIFHGFKRSVLAKYLNTLPENISFDIAEKGKPFVTGKFRESLSFNFSHTENVCLLAVSKTGRLGIDIESINRKTDWQAISERFFTQYEQQKLLSISNTEQQRRAFYKLWTRKEAYIKMLGTGLSLSPTQFSLTVPPEPAALVKHHCNKYKAAEFVQLMEVKLPQFMDSYCATLASDYKILNYSLISYQKTEL